MLCGGGEQWGTAIDGPTCGLLGDICLVPWTRSNRTLILSFSKWLMLTVLHLKTMGLLEQSRIQCFLMALLAFSPLLCLLFPLSLDPFRPSSEVCPATVEQLCEGVSIWSPWPFLMLSGLLKPRTLTATTWLLLCFLQGCPQVQGDQKTV